MSLTGTASLGQLSEISSAFIKALPKSIDGLDPKEVILAVSRGEKLGKKINQMLLSLIMGDHKVITDDGAQKTSAILAEMRKHFSVFCRLKDKDLDKWFPRPIEPAERTFISTEETERIREFIRKAHTRHIDITLRERMLLELAYWKLTGEHLDSENYTYCAGSHFVDQGHRQAPSFLGWHWTGEGWYHKDYQVPICGVRIVVTP